MIPGPGGPVLRPVLQALLLALLLAGAAPPPPGRLTLYADGFYRGDTQVFDAAEGDIRTRFTPRSFRATGRWLVCSEVRFRGRCVEIDRDYPVESGAGLNFNIRSLQPLPAGSGTANPPQNAAPGGAALDGMAARFYPAPRYGGERVLACADGSGAMACARKSAADLCRRAGYREPAHFALQVDRGLYYLADVLCIRK